MTQAAGVVVTAGCHAFPAEPPGGFLRLSYAMLEPEWVDAAARTVAAAVLSGAR